MSNSSTDEMSPLDLARLRYDLTGICPEKFRSHDGAPCCICGKTRRDDAREAERAGYFADRDMLT